MQEYYVTRQISPKKKSRFGKFINAFVLLVAIPVVVISMLSLSIYFLFIWFIGTLRKSRTEETPAEVYHYEMVLLDNKYISITLIEDETDEELSGLNELWREKVYNEETCLYRAVTVPKVTAVDGKIVCFYLKEKSEGAILQVVKTNDRVEHPLNTELLMLYYQDLQVRVIANVGDFYLHNDSEDDNLIVGFNNKEKIKMEIVPR